MNRRTIVLIVNLAIGLFAATAAAQDASSPPKIASDSKDYGFVFGDDPLQASGLRGVTPRIAIVQHASRATLIRPRTAFVVELLKSVEHL